MTTRDPRPPKKSWAPEPTMTERMRVYFNPFLFTIEQNNEFIAKGRRVTSPCRCRCRR